MKTHNITTGVPDEDARFLSAKNKAKRAFMALLLSILVCSMQWQEDTPKPNVQPTIATVRRDGLHMGDSITIAAFPVSPTAAETLLPELKKRNVHIAFVMSRKQANSNPVLIQHILNDGHSAIIEGDTSELVINRRADDINQNMLLSELSDGCTLLCSAGNPDKCRRLLDIADTVRTQGIRILLPGNKTHECFDIQTHKNGAII